MTNAKEKSLELYNYYDNIIKDHTRGVSVKELSIQCAIIAVDEILKCHIWKYNSIEPYKYWQEVKQELEKFVTYKIS
jgi:hypothetical protein